MLAVGRGRCEVEQTFGAGEHEDYKGFLSTRRQGLSMKQTKEMQCSEEYVHEGRL